MKCVFLQNQEGAHLGFLLCSPGLDQPSGHCVLMVVPSHAELFDTPAAAMLAERREAGESSWWVTGRAPLSVVIRTPGLLTELFIELGESGSGSWGVVSGPERQVVGLAMLPPSSEPGDAAAG